MADVNLDSCGLMVDPSVDLDALKRGCKCNQPVRVGWYTDMSYNDLRDKPSLNGITISGAKTAADYGLANKTDIMPTVNAEFESVETVPERFNLPMMKDKINEVLGILKGTAAIAVAAVASAWMPMNAAAETGVYTTFVSNLWNDSVVVTNVNVGGLGYVTDVKTNGVSVLTGSVAELDGLASTNYVNTAVSKATPGDYANVSNKAYSAVSSLAEGTNRWNAVTNKQDKLPYMTNAIPWAVIDSVPSFIDMEKTNGWDSTWATNFARVVTNGLATTNYVNEKIGDIRADRITSGTNTIYATGDWVTRTNETAGVAVTNRLATVSDVNKKQDKIDDYTTTNAVCAIVTNAMPDVWGAWSVGQRGHNGIYDVTNTAVEYRRGQLEGLYEGNCWCMRLVGTEYDPIEETETPFDEWCECNEVGASISEEVFATNFNATAIRQVYLDLYDLISRRSFAKGTGTTLGLAYNSDVTNHSSSVSGLSTSVSGLSTSVSALATATNNLTSSVSGLSTSVSTKADKLTGAVYDFNYGTNFTLRLYETLTNVIDRMGGSVTNPPNLGYTVRYSSSLSGSNPGYYELFTLQNDQGETYTIPYEAASGSSTPYRGQTIFGRTATLVVTGGVSGNFISYTMGGVVSEIYGNQTHTIELTGDLEITYICYGD